MNVQFTATAHYEYGGDEIAVNSNLKDAKSAVENYLAQMADEVYPESINIMPSVDGQDVPTLNMEYMWSGWSNDVSPQEVVEELESY